MIRIDNAELAHLVSVNATRYLASYYYWFTPNGVCLVPFGDFVEIYESVEDMKENC